MDWRPASRSRSRPPESSFSNYDHLGMISHPDQRYPYDDKFAGPSSAPAGPSILSMSRRSPARMHADLPPLYDAPTEDDYGGHHPSSSVYPSPSFAPSSLPSYGLHGMTRVQPIATIGHQRSFPRHVRKSSFDHTVAKEGITPGLGGRHQVNGKPTPDHYVGMKRRADAPHLESMLRADPADLEGMGSAMASIHDSDGYDESGRSFPSSSFNFSYPSYDGMFESGASSSDGTQSYLTSPQNEHLTPAAAAASMAMAEGYANLNAANMTDNGDESTLDYRQLMGLVYPNMENGNSLSQNAYTVDPTQIMSAGEASYGTFHTSPSSDGWGNGRGSSTNASPEPYNSNASTPPSIENAAGSAAQIRRKFVGLKAEHKKKASGGAATSPTNARSSTDSPDPGEGEGKTSVEDPDAPPTLCTNCQTTNTPLWRRDPEGQPLCEYPHRFLSISVD